MIEYRTARPSDAEAIAQLHARSWRENYRGAFHDAFLDGDLPAERLRVWRERLDAAPANHFVLLAVDGANLLGFVCAYGAHDPDWGALIDNLHVARDSKRSGIGAELMRRAGAWLAAQYPDAGVYLLVLESNTPARRFYERLGGTNAGVSTMETHGGAMVRSCRYVWPAAQLLARPSPLALVQHDAGLWSTEYSLDWPAGLIPIPVRMTVIRLDDGRLIVHSPGPISRELGEELDALGRVAFLVVPQQHGKFTRAAAERYPDAQLLAAAAAPRGQKSVSFHSSLGDQPPAAWSGQVECHLVRGFRLGEVVLFHRPSRTLVIADLCLNIHHASSRIAQAFFRANGMWRRFGPSRLIRRLAVSDRAALQRSLDRILQWDFERILPGHGEVIERAGPAALRAAWPK